jgi:hypothetical protein
MIHGPDIAACFHLGDGLSRVDRHGWCWWCWRSPLVNVHVKDLFSCFGNLELACVMDCLSICHVQAAQAVFFQVTVHNLPPFAKEGIPQVKAWVKIHRRKCLKRFRVPNGKKLCLQCNVWWRCWPNIGQPSWNILRNTFLLNLKWSSRYIIQVQGLRSEVMSMSSSYRWRCSWLPANCRCLVLMLWFNSPVVQCVMHRFGNIVGIFLRWAEEIKIYILKHSRLSRTRHLFKTQFGNGVARPIIWVA